MGTAIKLDATYEEAEAVARGWCPVLAVAPGMALTLSVIRPVVDWLHVRWLARDVTVEYTAPRSAQPHFVLHATIGPREPDAIDAAAYCLGAPWDSYAERERRRQESQDDVIRQLGDSIYVDHWTHLYDGLGFRVAARPEPGMGGLQVGALGHRPLSALGRAA